MNTIMLAQTNGKRVYQMNTTPTPGKELLLQVRIAFLQQGTSLSRWCINNGANHSYAHQALTGKGNYPSILAFRQKILIAAGLIEAAPVPAAARKRKQA